MASEDDAKTGLQSPDEALSRVAMGALALVVSVIVIFVTVLIWQGRASDTSGQATAAPAGRCETASGLVDSLRLTSGPPTQTAVATPLKVALGYSNSMSIHQVVVSGGPRGTVGAELTQEFASSDGGMVPLNQIRVAAEPTALGNVKMTLCIDPSRPVQVAPGRYNGLVEVRSGSSSTTVPVEVTRKAGWRVPVGLLIAGALIGVLIKLLTRVGRNQTESARENPSTNGGEAPAATAVTSPSGLPIGFWKAVEVSLREGEFWVAFMVGAVACVLAYWAMYDVNTTWGSNGPADMGKLFTSAVLAMAAGMSIGEAAGGFTPAVLWGKTLGLPQTAPEGGPKTDPETPAPSEEAPSTGNNDVPKTARTHA